MQKVCKACQLGKEARHAFPHHVESSKRPLEVIHSDVWNTKTKSIKGSNYYVSFIDGHIRSVWMLCEGLEE